MFRIGEFSKLVRVSARMLRHYEKAGLICPAEIDSFTGYRRYSLSQMPLVGRITMLRDMGFSVEEIGEILQRFDDRAFMDITLRRREAALITSIQTEQERLRHVLQMLSEDAMERGMGMIYDVELRKLDSVRVVSLRKVIPSPDREGELWQRMDEFTAENGIECGQGGYSIYHDDEYKETDVDVEVAVPVNKDVICGEEFVCKELPEIPLAVTAKFSGPYDNYAPTIEKIGNWIERNGYELAGNVRGLAIVRPSEHNAPDDYLTELQAPVRKK